jgi:predicted outer membrane repeat protein
VVATSESSTRCRFEANSGKNGGGAIFFGETLATDCLFRQNSAFSLLGSAPAQGGGALASGDNVRFERCTFDQNFSEGVGCGARDPRRSRGRRLHLHAQLCRTGFLRSRDLRRGGPLCGRRELSERMSFRAQPRRRSRRRIALNSPQLELEACTFAGNSSTGENGSGGALACLGGGQIDASRILIWNNCAEQGHDAAWLESGTTLSLACSDIRQTEIGGGGSVVADAFTFEADPQFCDTGSCASSPDAQGDYSITHDSPCTAVFSPCGERVGALDPACWVTDAPVHESVEAPEVRLLENPARGRVTFQLWLPAPKMSC